jgi:putative membrane protein
MRTLAALSGLALLLTLPVSAQIGNPAGMAPGTQEKAPGVPAPHEPNTQDRLFARIATIGGKAEVELGRLAEQKGGSDAVKDFGRRMVQDHGKANGQLTDLAKRADIPLPGDLDQEHSAMQSELEAMSGPAFDRAYMLGQIVEHQKTVQLLEWEINFGQDAQIKRFASETLPTVLQHLQMAQDLMSRITGQALQGAAPGTTLASNEPVRRQDEPGGSGTDGQRGSGTRNTR